MVGIAPTNQHTWVFPKIGVFPPKWMFYTGKPLSKWMIWGENPLFSETPKGKPIRGQCLHTRKGKKTPRRFGAASSRSRKNTNGYSKVCVTDATCQIFRTPTCDMILGGMLRITCFHRKLTSSPEKSWVGRRSMFFEMIQVTCKYSPGVWEIITWKDFKMPKTQFPQGILSVPTGVDTPL